MSKPIDIRAGSAWFQRFFLQKYDELLSSFAFDLQLRR